MGFDPVSYAMGAKAGGGGSSVTVEALSVTENGTYTAPSGKAWNEVEVDVPQTTVDPSTVEYQHPHNIIEDASQLEHTVPIFIKKYKFDGAMLMEWNEAIAPLLLALLNYIKGE